MLCARARQVRTLPRGYVPRARGFCATLQLRAHRRDAHSRPRKSRPHGLRARLAQPPTSRPSLHSHQRVPEGAFVAKSAAPPPLATRSIRVGRIASAGFARLLRPRLLQLRHAASGKHIPNSSRLSSSVTAHAIGSHRPKEECAASEATQRRGPLPSVREAGLAVHDGPSVPVKSRFGQKNQGRPLASDYSCFVKGVKGNPPHFDQSDLNPKNFFFRSQSEFF